MIFLKYNYVLEFPMKHFGSGVSVVDCSLTTSHLLWEYIGLDSLSFLVQFWNNTFLESCILYLMIPQIMKKGISEVLSPSVSICVISQLYR